MDCPSCNHTLTTVNAEGIRVFGCHGGCGGLWFDHFELKKTMNPSTGSMLLHLERADGVRVFRDVDHPCPKCRTTLLFRHFFSRGEELEVDQCAKCGGFWIEPGTLAEIPKRYPDPQDRARAIQAYFEIVFSGKVMEMQISNSDILESARMIVRIFRFLCPEDHLPADPLKDR